MLRRVVRFGAPLPLLYLANKATSRTPKVAKAKSEKAPFEYAKYKVTPKHLQEEVAELECRMNNQLTCPNGIYNQAAAEGFSEWTQCHHSVETSNSLTVWTRKRDTGEVERIPPLVTCRPLILERLPPSSAKCRIQKRVGWICQRTRPARM